MCSSLSFPGQAELRDFEPRAGPGAALVAVVIEPGRLHLAAARVQGRKDGGHGRPSIAEYTF